MPSERYIGSIVYALDQEQLRHTNLKNHLNRVLLASMQMEAVIDEINGVGISKANIRLLKNWLPVLIFCLKDLKANLSMYYGTLCD